MSVVAEALLFDEFGSAAGDTALTVSCTDTAAAGEMSQALMIVALCPELSAAMVQGKLPAHAPLFALNVSPGEAATLTVMLFARSGPLLVTTMV